MELLFDIYRVSVWDDENLLDMDSDVGCETMWMYLIPPNCNLKIIKIVNYVIYIIRFLKN